jgi:hypothetical protein
MTRCSHQRLFLMGFDRNEGDASHDGDGEQRLDVAGIPALMAPLNQREKK